VRGPFGARIVLAGALLLGPVRGAAQAPAPEALAKLEREIAAAHDGARSDPTGFAAHLEARKTRFDGDLLRTPGQPPSRRRKGS
jgi:hypothetical protein